MVHIIRHYFKKISGPFYKALYHSYATSGKKIKCCVRIVKCLIKRTTNFFKIVSYNKYQMEYFFNYQITLIQIFHFNKIIFISILFYLISFLFSSIPFFYLLTIKHTITIGVEESSSLRRKAHSFFLLLHKALLLVL